MEYTVERALHTNSGIFNIGDNVLIYTKDNEPVETYIMAIYWKDEYHAYIVTSKGDFLLKDVVDIEYMVPFQE